MGFNSGFKGLIYTFQTWYNEAKGHHRDFTQGVATDIVTNNRVQTLNIRLTPWKRISSESNSFSVSQEIFPVYGTRKVSLIKVTEARDTSIILRQTNPTKTSHYIFCTIHFNITLPFTTRSSKWFFPSRFPHQKSLCISVIPICSTFPTYLNLSYHLFFNIVLG